MTEVGFYHCTRTPAEDAAVRLAGRAYGAGHRVLLVADPETLARLDDRLWAEPEASFLPHGLDDPLNQPVHLSESFEPANGATLLLSVAAGLPPEPARFQRVINLFDDATPAHARARTDWRALAGREGVEPCYWRQQGGRWVKSA